MWVRLPPPAPTLLDQNLPDLPLTSSIASNPPASPPRPFLSRTLRASSPVSDKTTHSGQAACGGALPTYVGMRGIPTLTNISILIRVLAPCRKPESGLRFSLQGHPLRNKRKPALAYRRRNLLILNYKSRWPYAEPDPDHEPEPSANRKTQYRHPFQRQSNVCRHHMGISRRFSYILTA